MPNLAINRICPESGEWRSRESNPAPIACEAIALPYELDPPITIVQKIGFIKLETAKGRYHNLFISLQYERDQNIK